jgi:DNA-binding response OmpR family regulator
MSEAAVGEVGGAVESEPQAAPLLLVVEDDARIAAGLVRGLGEAGFRVELVNDGALALTALGRSRPDLVVLDLMLPVLSGFELLDELQGRPHPPIIAVTARTDLQERLRCFELGVVDYLAKPFFLEELVARIRARLVRPAASPRRLVQWADASLDLDARTVTVAGVVKALTRYELDVLTYLVERSGRAISRQQLAERALAGASWEGPEPRTIDTHVARLRKKLGEEAAAAVETVWGIGYRFAPRSTGAEPAR